jgi:AAA+ superfamily predicted ATPase
MTGAIHPAVAMGLEAIRSLLAVEVNRLREQGVPAGQDEFRGLYVGEADVDRALNREADPEVVHERIAALNVIAGVAVPGPGPLGTLVQHARLSTFETSVVLLALASEADLGIERVISFAQDDVTKKRPRVDLALRMLSRGEDEVDCRRAFEADSALRRYLIISLQEEAGQALTPLIGRSIALDARVSSFLLGGRGLDEDLLPHSLLVRERADAPPLALPANLTAQVEALCSLPPDSLDPPHIGLYGPDRAQRLAVASRLALASGLAAVRVDAATAAAALGFDIALTRALREAAFQDAALFFDNLDTLTPADQARLRERVEAGVPARLAIFGSTNNPQAPALNIELTEPDFDARVALWQTTLPSPSPVTIDELYSLAGKFRLSVDGVRDAVVSANGIARWREPQAPQVRIEDLYAAARTRSTPILNDLARKITPHYKWDDIVLPDDTREQLREMCAFVEHKHQVYDVWGFDKKLAMGKGLMALFAGNSGTGKTMAADVIAATLSLDLYKIDLSTVVSKYIGETEKNLKTIFQEAESSNAILFFDEADALFGKRSEVKDAHDRYANIETAYLLQKMEEYSGAVVLASNLKMNLDDAFLRRMHFVIDFEMPDETQRLRIWQSTVPPEMPLAGDVDFAFLARQFRLAGGNIRNICLAAAFLAADDRTDVTMRHFIRAVRREYQKLGKMVTDAEFGAFRELL